MAPPHRAAAQPLPEWPWLVALVLALCVSVPVLSERLLARPVAMDRASGQLLRIADRVAAYYGVHRTPGDCAEIRLGCVAPPMALPRGTPHVPGRGSAFQLRPIGERLRAAAADAPQYAHRIEVHQNEPCWAPGIGSTCIGPRVPEFPRSAQTREVYTVGVAADFGRGELELIELDLYVPAHSHELARTAIRVVERADVSWASSRTFNPEAEAEAQLERAAAALAERFAVGDLACPCWSDAERVEGCETATSGVNHGDPAWSSLRLMLPQYEGLLLDPAYAYRIHVDHPDCRVGHVERQATGFDSASPATVYTLSAVFERDGERHLMELPLVLRRHIDGLSWGRARRVPGADISWAVPSR